MLAYTNRHLHSMLNPAQERYNISLYVDLMHCSLNEIRTENYWLCILLLAIIIATGCKRISGGEGEWYQIMGMYNSTL